MSSKRAPEILLIEDNEGDILLTQTAFSDLDIGNNLSVVRDGVEALDYLFKQGSYSDAITPDLIILDLNLPRKDGREVLAELKKHSSLKKIPILVLTTSTSKNDVLTCYDLRANTYINKPIDYLQFLNIAKYIKQFWLTAVVLPTQFAE